MINKLCAILLCLVGIALPLYISMAMFQHYIYAVGFVLGFIFSHTLTLLRLVSKGNLDTPKRD